MAMDEIQDARLRLRYTEVLQRAAIFIHKTNIKTFVKGIYKYKNICYDENVRRTRHEELFIKGSHSGIKGKWMV